MSVSQAAQSFSPLPHSTDFTQTVGKRKRSEDAENAEAVNGIEGDDEAEDEGQKHFNLLLLDIREILQSVDTQPSILNQPLRSITENTRATKRAKLSSSSVTTTVASQIQSFAYHNIEEVIADIDNAVSILNNDGFGKVESESIASSTAEGQARSKRTARFMKVLGEVVRRELIQRPHLLGSAMERATDEKIFVSSEELKGPDSSFGISWTGKSVLTLYGSAPTPKQLFSSLPLSHRMDLANGIRVTDISMSGTEETKVAGETSLPIGISTTKVVPVHGVDTTEAKEKIPTLGDLFTAPNALPLNPPRTSRHTATRSSSVSWFNPAELTTSIKPRGGEKSWTNQLLSSGQWLSYNTSPSSAHLAAAVAEERLKQRHQDSSLHEFNEDTTSTQTHKHAKDDALYKSTYSNFAPSHDNAAALVPQQTKNKLWWMRTGKSKYERYFDIFDHDETEEILPEDSGVETTGNEDEDLEFKEAVESWSPEELPEELLSTEETALRQEDKDVDEILAEISELLETLHSYQQVRNLSLPNSTRTAASQNTQLANVSGSPATPSVAEFDVYSMLKSQLTLMIASLPPAAVARLNGDHLAGLSVSTKITIEAKDYKGTMEDIEAKLRQQALPVAAAVPARTPAATGNASRAGYYQPAAATPANLRGSYGASSATRPNAPSATHPSQQYSGRPPPPTGQYGSYTSQQGSSNRQSYSQYGQQTPSAHSGQHINGTRQHPVQNGYSTYGQQQVASPAIAGSSSGPVPQPQRPSQPGYQQRAQSSYNYSAYGGAGMGRSSSPQNAQAPPGSFSPQHRPSYGTSSTPSTPAPVAQAASQSRPQYYPPSAHVSSSNSTAVQVNGAGTVGQQLGLTAEEQAMLMQRQKAQLQQQMQGVGRQGSVTPSPLVNGQNGGVDGAGSGSLSNGTTTPAPQPNGIVAGQGS